MKIVELLVVRDDVDVVDAHIAFQLNAGVDLILVGESGAPEVTHEIVERYVREGYARWVPQEDDAEEPAWRASMAELAVKDHGADWLIDADVDEFWMPRAESLHEVLIAIPDRYGIVQALVRVFRPRADDARFFAERMTVRRPQYSEAGESMGRIEWALRPVVRARAMSAVGHEREAALDGRVPLRAWYPIEVLRFPIRSIEQAERWVRSHSVRNTIRSRIEAQVLDAYKGATLREVWGQLVEHDEFVDEHGSELVSDTRLVEALRRLERASGQDGQGGAFSLPNDANSLLGLRSPTVVDDAAYAGECAAVGEVAFDLLIARISALEQRIGSLETGFWPRVLAVLSRIRRRLLA